MVCNFAPPKNQGYAKSRFLPYFLIIILESAATLGLWHIDVILPLGHYPFAYTILNVFIAYIFGLSAALFAFFLGLIGYLFFFIIPQHPGHSTALALNDWAGIVGYTVASMLGCTAAIVLRHNRLRFEALLEELFLKNRRLELYVTNSPLSVIEWDPEFRITDWSPESERIFGWKKEEVIGKRPDEFKFVYEEDIPPVNQLIYDLTHGISERSTFFNRNYCKDGRVIYCQWYNSVLRDDEGKLRSILSFALDVTEREEALQSLSRSEEVFRTVAENAPDVITRYDTETRHIYVGPLIEKATGMDRSQFIGKKLTEVGDPQYIEPMHSAVLESIRTGEAKTAEFTYPSPEGLRSYEAKLVPEKDSQGKVLSVIAISRDITERKRIAELNDALNSINTTINSTLDFEEIIERVVESAAAALKCESAGLALVEDGNWVVKHSYKMPLNIRGYVFGVDELLPEIDISGWRNPVALNETSRCNVHRIEIFNKLNIRSCLAVPLVLRDRTIGGLFFNYHSDSYDFVRPELDFAEKLSVSVSLALENSRFYNEQKDLTAQTVKAKAEVQSHYELLQRALIPDNPIAGAGYSVAAEYIPIYGREDIGGDFYDVFKTESGKLGVLIGDVAGKGIHAAALAAVTRSTVRAFAFDFSDASKALTHANSVIMEHKESFETFVTVCLALIDVDTGEMTYASAGHPPAAICRANGDVEFLTVVRPPFGAVQNQQYEQQTLSLETGDKLILYTDGITEARNDGTVFGVQGIESVLKKTCIHSPEIVLNSILDAATECANGQLRDDAAILIVALEPKTTG